MAVFICTCCGSEVTVPYFFGNGVYGWSCIKKVNPAAKKRARNILVKADKIEWVGNNVIAHLYGKRLNVTTYAQRYAADRELSVEQKNGYFYVYYHSTKRWCFRGFMAISQKPIKYAFEFSNQPVDHIYG